MSLTITPGQGPTPAQPVKRKRSRQKRTSLLAHGEPMVWLTGGALAVAGVMVLGLMVLVLGQGARTFWPVAVTHVITHDDRTVMGEVTRVDRFRLPYAALGELAGPQYQTTRAAFDAAIHGKAADYAGADFVEQTDKLRDAATRKMLADVIDKAEQIHLALAPFEQWVQQAEPALAARLGQELTQATGADITGAALAAFQAGPHEAYQQWRALPSGEEMVQALTAQPDQGYAIYAQAVLNQMLVDVQSAPIRRRLVRTGNYELTGEHFFWVSDLQIAQESQPQWAMTVERLAWGRFYGTPKAFKIDGEVAAEGPEAAWRLFQEHHQPARQRFRQQVGLEKHETGAVNSRMESARLRMVQTELSDGRDSQRYAQAKARYEQVREQGEAEHRRIRTAIDRIKTENARYALVFDTAQGREVDLQAADVVRAYPANQVSRSPGNKLSLYAGRWWEFLTGEPREANSEGGVFPAIFGTVMMTLIMCTLVVPFGVLAALYLREYAKAGPIISAVRIAINNLAGVPSIVFGVFGLGFFVYVIGAYLDGGPRNALGMIMPAPWWFALLAGLALVMVGSVALLYLGQVVRGANDTRGRQLMRAAGATGLALAALAGVLLVATTPFFDGFFPAQVANRNPVFGKTALIWGSFTLALLTLPVVIVATEEALSAVPNSMREGSYACGASKWQTIKRIVLSRAMPGIMTGAILAMARGAGEVAPLMLVGAIKLAPELPFSVHSSEQFGMNRSFMHLGFHIYDLGFQSQNSEAAKPMVYTTTLLLIVLIAVLNLAAIRLRSRLRRKFEVSGF